MATIRSAGIHGLVPVARAHGVDPVSLVVAIELDPAVLDHEDLPVAEAKLAALMEYAAAQIGIEDLGLQVAAHHDLTMLGPLAVVIANSATGADAFGAAQRFLRLHSGAHVLAVVQDPDGDPEVIGLEIRSTFGGSPSMPATQSMDASLGFMHRVLTFLFGENYGLVSVELGYRPTADLEVHREFYGAPVAVDRPATMLRVRAKVFEEPIAGADHAVHEQAEAYLLALLPDEDDLPGRVRKVVRQLLTFGPVSISTVARSLSIHPRTLQRRLGEAGVGFAQLVDDERRAEAQQLLAETDLSLLAVSARLGFAEQATLTRACRRWWGVTPSQVRA